MPDGLKLQRPLLPWERAQTKVTPATPRGRPAALDELLRMAGQQVEQPADMGASAKVTAGMAPPRVPERETGPGITTRYLSREAYEALGLDPDVFLREVQPTKESLYQKIQKYPIAAAQTPITVGPITLSAGEWAGLFGMAVATGGAAVASLPLAYQGLMRVATTRNINAWSMKTNTPINPSLRSAVADWIARSSKPSWLNSARAVKELFKPSQGGKLIPTQEAATKAQQYTSALVDRWLPEFSRTRTTEVIAGIQAGKYQPDYVAPLVQAVQAGRMELGKVPEMPPTAPVAGVTPPEGVETPISVQTGLPGMERPAQMKAFEEFGTAPGMGGAKPGLVDIEALKRAQAAKPLEGQVALPETPEVYEMRSELEGLKAYIETEPASQYLYLAPKGEVNTVSRSNYIALNNKEPQPSVIVTRTSTKKTKAYTDKNGKYHPARTYTEEREVIPWEYALDEKATELGYADGDTFKEAIEKAWTTKQQIKKLEADIAFAKSEPEAGILESLVKEPEITPPAVPPPPPAETKIAAEPPPVEPSGKISFAPLQDIQTVIDYSTKPNVSRWLANLPGLRQIMSRVNPAAIANTPAEKFIIGRAVLGEEGTQKSQGIVSYLGELGNQDKVFGKLDDNGLIGAGKLKGLSINDIRTYPKRYTDKLTAEQKKWIQRARDIEEAKLKYLRDNDIDIKELTFEEGGEYAGRRVFAKVSSDGEILDTTYVGAGPTRVGKKAGFEKPRSYATAKEAIDDGYRYIPDEDALALNVRAAYNRVTDKKASEWLLTQVPWRTNGAPEELVLAAESAKMRANSSRQLVAAINRAVRGERVPDATLNSIARTYPDEAAELKNLIPQIQTGKPTAKDVQSLTKRAKALVKSDNADKWAAINARARAREAAMAPKMGEAMVMHPAFSGKIFTGPEAKELSDTLRQALDPGMSEALTSVNKVNAVVRYFKLAGDFSPMAIQLIFLAGSNPRIYGGAAAAIPKILLDPEWQDRFLSEHKPVIDRHPGLLLSTAGTEFTEAMAKGGMLSTRINVWPKQEAMLKKLGLIAPRAVGKAGAIVLQPFQRVFEGTLDYAGIKMAEALEHLAKTPAEVAEVDQFINEFRGLTSSAKLGVSPNWRMAETATLLAPRYNRAIAALLVDAGKGAASFGQSGIRNRLAIQGLTKGIAAISAVALAISWARGEDWDEIKEHFDPLSPKFFTWNVAGQNIGPGSKVRSVVKLVAQSIDNPEALWQSGMENPVLRFIRGNLAPVLGSTIDILTGRNYIGDPVRQDAMNFTEEVLVKQFLPIWVENVIYEGGSLSQRLIRGAGEFFGGRAYPETTSDALNRLYDRYAAKDYGKKAEELNKLERSKLERKYTDLAEAKADNEKYWSERGDQIGIALDIEQQKLEDAMHKSLNDAAQKLLSGQMSKYDYDKNRSYIRPYTSGGKSALWSLRETLKPYEMKQYEKWYAENTRPEDKAYDDYQEYRATLIEKAELPLDWDAIELEIESYLNKYPAKTKQYIKDRQDEWIKNLPPAARQIELQRAPGIEDETWWDDYREVTQPARSGQPSTLNPFQKMLERKFEPAQR